jgi:hypothetical protein
VGHLLARLGVALILAACLPVLTASPAAASPLPGTSCSLFPTDSIFNTDISGLPVHPQSATWKGNMTQHTNLHPDFGTVAQQYGIPFNVAPPPSAGLAPAFLYDGESDHPAEGYPINQGTLTEGGPAAPGGSDRHALVVNKNTCKLYELFNLQNFVDGQRPSAGSGAVWDLRSNAMRPDGWTSADAAGLPILPLLLRPDEIQAGSINHAIRFTTHCTHGHIWPGSHDAGLCASGFPPMGARLRLRSSFDISGFSPPTQVVLRAFQHYGLVLADNGADWYFQGTTDDWWGSSPGDRLVTELKGIPAAQFDAVDESGLRFQAGSYQAVVTPTAGAYYRPLDPIRILDTRDGTGGRLGRLGPGEVFNVQLAGANGVDAAALAGVVNVTVTNASAPSYVTLYPSGQAQPLASNLNFGPSQQVANLVQVATGAGGRVTVYNDQGYADVIIDLNGFYTALAASGSPGLFFPLASPNRVLDTRTGLGGHPGRLGPGSTVDLRLTGTPGVPGSGVWAVVLNLTATGGSAGSYLAAYPAGAANRSSSVNFPAGRDLANRAIVKLGPGGFITVLNSEGWVDVVVDVAGYFGDGSGSSAGGVTFHATPPQRLIDTRPEFQVGPFNQPIGPDGVLTATAAGQGFVPATAVAVSANFTVTNTPCGTFLTVYPAGAPRPLASDLNLIAYETRPNLVIARLGGGALSAYNALCTADLVIDVAGWYG